MDYYLAVDIGASSGRHILAHMENGKIILEEIYRFENGIEDRGEVLCWDYTSLFKEILIGLKKCRELNKIPKSMGIDTWAVDFVLLDENDNIIGNSASYRDSRTIGMDSKVYEIIDEISLYKRTGIQKQMFNTIYQLMAVKNQQYIAKTMLLVPDYFNFLLTGIKKTEYTNSTTTQLVSPSTKNWDWELIEKLGYNLEIFTEIIEPKKRIGNFSKEIQKILGFDCSVIAPATHDTGSAIVAVPYGDDKSIYISSGTWSLMGVELDEANCSMESYNANFTNEGGFGYRFRYLKNIMGLWIIQNVKKELYDEYSFKQLCDLAEKETINSIINCNDIRLTAPDNMISVIQLLCEETEQVVPHTVGEIARVVYRSLANCYKETLEEIKVLTNREYQNIYIIGGGAKATYLNKLTKEFTGINVRAMPIEATALGNILVQMINDGVFENLAEARKYVEKSFEIENY